jgi:hypothetical protein
MGVDRALALLIIVYLHSGSYSIMAASYLCGDGGRLDLATTHIRRATLSVADIDSSKPVHDQNYYY